MTNSILPLFLGGLILFIFSISQLSAALEGFFAGKAKVYIDRFTNNVWRSLLAGILATALMGSSSAVIIITIVLINAKGLSFRNSMGIILGANIGTTVSSQLIALDISSYAVIPMALGLVILIFFKQKPQETYGRALFYFGLLFFGLFVMEESVMPLRESEFFITQLTQIDESAFKGVWVGGLMTLLIQSSSATVGIAILLGKQGLIEASGGIAIMLGAELGTCSDTLLATIKGSRAALRAGVFHLTFNLLSISVGLLFFDYLLQLIYLVSKSSEMSQLIANGHVIFNILGVLMILPFIPFFEKLLNRIIPNKIVQ